MEYRSTAGYVYNEGGGICNVRSRVEYRSTAVTSTTEHEFPVPTADRAASDMPQSFKTAADGAECDDLVSDLSQMQFQDSNVPTPGTGAS